MTGFWSGVAAFTIWGLVPVYWKLLAHVPAIEVLGHRIVWSLPVLLALTAVAGGWRDLFRVLATRQLVLTLLASALFLAANWLLYIYATVTNRVTEAGLGYYMMPLVNAALATVFLGERLRPLHYPALALVAVGVAVPCVAEGYLPWLALTITTTFGVYGLIRKRVAVESVTGLTVESLLLLPASAAYLLVITFIGLALGPYTIGQLSDLIGLRGALLAGLGANALALVCLVPAVRNLVRDERTHEALMEARDAQTLYALLANATDRDAA